MNNARRARSRRGFPGDDPDAGAFERRVAAWCRRHDLLPAGARVVAAVSGGPDSMALLAALDALSRRAPGFEVVVAHLNHGRRGARGAADADFVARAASRLGLTCSIGKGRIGRRAGGSWEAAAREARYAFLARVARRVGADRVAVGHTADDQAETVIHRLCRGSGLRGAAAMPPDRPLAPGGSIRLIRPLLGVGRRDTIRYIRAKGVGCRLDETNRNLAWTRNRIRRRVLPLLSRDVHPEAPRALARFAAQAAEAYQLIVSEADAVERRGLLRGRADGYGVPAIDAAAVPAAVRGELWLRVLERLGIEAPASRDVDAVEEVLEGRRAVVSLRGGRVLVRRTDASLRFVPRADVARRPSRRRRPVVSRAARLS